MDFVDDLVLLLYTNAQIQTKTEDLNNTIHACSFTHPPRKVQNFENEHIGGEESTGGS